MDRIIKSLFSLFLFLGINASGQQIIPLYPDSIPNSTSKLLTNELPTLEVYFPEKGKTNGTSIIIFPGGAYAFLAYKEEGVVIAKAFAEQGITAFIVRYRLPDRNKMRIKSMGPLMDGQQAIKQVRSNALEWKIDPNKIGVIGFSAGGHLAATLGTHFKESYIENKENVNLRPDFMILVYPVISMLDELTHFGSRISLIGLEPPKDTIDFFSNETQVTKDTPPTYLTHTGDDGLVGVNNSVVFYQALLKNSVDAELHIYPTGNHGFIQRLQVAEWITPMIEFMKREKVLK